MLVAGPAGTGGAGGVTCTVCVTVTVVSTGYGLGAKLMTGLALLPPDPAAIPRTQETRLAPTAIPAAANSGILRRVFMAGAEPPSATNVGGGPCAAVVGGPVVIGGWGAVLSEGSLI